MNYAYHHLIPLLCPPAAAVPSPCRWVWVCASAPALRPRGGRSPPRGRKTPCAWLPDGYSKFLDCNCLALQSWRTMAPLRCAAKFDPFLSLDCAPQPTTPAQSKERKGSHFAIWQHCPCAPGRRPLCSDLRCRCRLCCTGDRWLKAPPKCSPSHSCIVGHFA